jgi:hypothetical protein
MTRVRFEAAEANEPCQLESFLKKAERTKKISATAAKKRKGER